MNKQFRFLRFAAPVSLAGLAGSAMAEVPAEVTTALGAMKTDGLAVAALVLIAIIAIAAFKFMKKGISG